MTCRTFVRAVLLIAMTFVATSCRHHVDESNCAGVGFDGPVAASAHDAVVAFLPTLPGFASTDATDWKERSSTDSLAYFELAGENKSQDRSQLSVTRTANGWKVTGSCA